MRALDRDSSTLLVVDFQGRLMPAIEGGTAAIANALRLVKAAELLDVPVVLTEQNPRGLGPTVADLADRGHPTVHKMTFDATPALKGHLPVGRPDMVVVGCEAHVCVLQTVLGLLDEGHRIAVVRDAIGSRATESKLAAIERMARHGAGIVTTEMVIFEWLGSAEHPQFRAALQLVK